MRLPDRPAFQDAMLADLDQRWAQAVRKILALPDWRFERLVRVVGGTVANARAMSDDDLKLVQAMAHLAFGEAWHRALLRLEEEKR